MDYPLQLTFKILAVAPQMWVKDANGRLLFYVKQKLFKLRESVTVFGDEQQTRTVARIQADRILDISATYRFEDASGRPFGALKREGLRSFWRAHYDLSAQDRMILQIREENPLAKVADSMLGQVPVLNLLTAYLFHPKYLVSRPNGPPVLRVTKQPALWEGKFKIDRLSMLDPSEEALAVTGIMMMVLLERRSG